MLTVNVAFLLETKELGSVSTTIASIARRCSCLVHVKVFCSNGNFPSFSVGSIKVEFLDIYQIEFENQSNHLKEGSSWNLVVDRKVDPSM